VTPDVTVIVPCYDQGAFVADAVDSALASTVDALEVIVVDDGSTEPETRAVLDRLVRPRTRVFRQHNRGLVATRNRALAAARGRYVLPLDADDTIAPTFVEKTRRVLDEDRALGFAYTHVRFFGDGEFVCRTAPYNFYTLLWENVCCNTALIRREPLEAVGGWAPLDGYEDWDVWISLAERGWHGRLVPEVLFNYRRHGCTQGVRARRRHAELVRSIRAYHPALYDRARLAALRGAWCRHPVLTDLALAARAAVRSPYCPRRVRAGLAAVRDASPWARKLAPGGA